MLDDPSRRRWTIVAALLLIAAATLVPHPRDVWPRDFWCWSCREKPDAVELALNILLFVPLGISLSREMRPSRAMAAIVATTVAVELLQYFYVVGRSGVVRDVVGNVAGGILGLAIGLNAKTLVRPDERTAKRIAWIAAGVWVAHALLAMAAFRPSATPYLFYAQIRPQLGQYDVYRGVVANASVNGATVFDGPFPPGVDSKAWTSEPLDLAASVATAPPTTRPAPILAIADSRTNEIAFLGESRGNLVFRSRTRGVDFGLRAPVVILSHAFTAPTSPRRSGMLVSGVRDGYMVSTSVQPADAEVRSVTTTLTPSLGWSLWWPLGIPGPWAIAWMTWLWLTVPVAAIAFWSGAALGRGARGKLTAVTPALVAVAGAHALVPWSFGARPIGVWLDAMPIAIGLVIGLALGASRKSGSRT